MQLYPLVIKHGNNGALQVEIHRTKWVIFQHPMLDYWRVSPTVKPKVCSMCVTKLFRNFGEKASWRIFVQISTTLESWRLPNSFLIRDSNQREAPAAPKFNFEELIQPRIHHQFTMFEQLKPMGHHVPKK